MLFGWFIWVIYFYFLQCHSLFNYWLSGSTACSQCRVGTYQSNTGQASCLSCAPGSYQDTVGMPSCKPCQPGKHQSYWEQTQCTACTRNWYQDQPGQSFCKQCSGYQCVNTAKTQCIGKSSSWHFYFDQRILHTHQQI